jgi:hypothetical protein
MLLDPVPNPSSGETVFRFCLPHDGPARFTLYDISGRETASIVHDEAAAGWQQIVWLGEDIPSGVYLWRLEQRGKSRTVRQVLLRE